MTCENKTPSHRVKCAVTLKTTPKMLLSAFYRYLDKKTKRRNKNLHNYLIQEDKKK